MALGAAAAPSVDHRRTIWTLVAFLLAVGLGAHALDELHGHPLGTRLSDRTLAVLGFGGIGAGAAIGVVGAVLVGWWVLIIVAAGVWLAVAYNLELVGGRFHSDVWFAIGWGGFPALVGYVINAGSIGWACLAVTAGCIALSVAQRSLSTPVRRLRRRTLSVDGVQRLDDGTALPVSAASLAAPLDRALVAFSCGITLVAVALLAARW